MLHRYFGNQGVGSHAISAFQPKGILASIRILWVFAKTEAGAKPIRVEVLSSVGVESRG